MNESCTICCDIYDKKNRKDMTPYILSVCSFNCFSIYLDKAKQLESLKRKFGSDNSEFNEFLDRSHNYRSSYEERFSRILKKAGVDSFLYEPYYFILSDRSRYVPDFYLPEHGLFFEVKGLYYPQAKKKIKMFYDEYPFTVWLVDLEFMKDMK